MLTWRQENGIWYGNGYRVEQESPHSWHLSCAEDTNGSRVLADWDPIAVLPSLRACRQKAETLHEQEHLSLFRRRLALIAIVAAFMAAMSGSSPIVALAFGVVSAAASLEHVWTWLGPFFGAAREVTQ